MSIRKRLWSPNSKGKFQNAQGKRFDKMCWQLDYKDQDGKRKVVSFKTQGEAKEAEIKIRGEVANKTHVPRSKSITVADAAKRWLNVKGNPNGRRRAVEASTLRNYRQHCRDYIKPALGTVKLVDLRRSDVDSFVDKRLLGEYGLSRAMAHKVLVSLKSIIKLAVEDENVGRNVATGITIDQDTSTEKAEVEIPSKEEIAALAATMNELCEDPSPAIAKAWQARRAFVLTAIDTGMRASELRGLKWENVDFENGVIRVRDRADENGEFGELKSPKANRDIPVSSTLLQVLRVHNLAQGRHRTLVFGTSADKPQALANIFARCWKPLQIKAGLCDEVDGRLVHRYKFHSLRHYHASVLIDDSDTTLKEVQEEMGHADIQMTMNTYAHIMKSEEHDEKRRRRAERNSVASLSATQIG